MNKIEQKIASDIYELAHKQVKNVEKEVDIVDFASILIDAHKKGHIPRSVLVKMFENLKKEYDEIVFKTAYESVAREFFKRAEKVTNMKKARAKDIGDEDKKYVFKTEEELIDEVEDLDDLEEVKEEDDDLEYIITSHIRTKNIEIEKTIGFFPQNEAGETYCELKY